MICGNCQQWTSKVTITEHGKEQCEHCSNGGLHLEPAWMRHRPVPRWESHPKEYKKREQPDGSVLMEPTDESKADLEAMVTKVSDDDKQAIESRRNRQAGEIDFGKAHTIASNFKQHYEEVWKEYEQANAEYWNTQADDLKVQ